jgi:hypothetical protein
MDPEQSRLQRFLATRRDALRSPGDRFRLMRALVTEGLDWLPAPGSGQTLHRWQALASVAGFDLSLAKLFESHTDAVAIFGELRGSVPPPGSLWAVWAAESPTLRVQAKDCGGGYVRLEGTKPWCSGAAGVTHALLTAWTDEAKPILAAVCLEESNVGIDEQEWHAVGMAPTATAHVTFNGCAAARIGGAGDYLSRPGFWHGAAGIAACWYGAAMALAATAREHSRLRSDPHAAAHLGALDAALAGASAALREAADKLDHDPARDFRVDALRVRAVVENAAERVLRHAGRAMGASPFCNDAAFARLAADLPVFLRQSHAERDLAVLGQQLAEGRADPWAL